jgi:hypothetical protein
VTQEQFKDVAPSLAPFLQHAHDQATKSLKEGREALSDITDIHNVKVDTESVASTAHDIVHGYFERDLFFWGK